MTSARETGVYLLTSTHLGTGQAAGAIDLPLVREHPTGLPYLPASALKGVARDCCERLAGAGKAAEDEKKSIKRYFGSPPPQPNQSAEALLAGELLFFDGLLLAFPVRSLTQPFFWVTSPLLIHRWNRQRSAFGLERVDTTKLMEWTATADLAAHVLLEDLPVPRPLKKDDALVAVAEAWGSLLPDKERDGVAANLCQRLICVPDADLQHLVTIGTPVRARVQLTDGKTTDVWRGTDEQGKEVVQKGNLWYEEYLPPECLFAVMISTRPGRNNALPWLAERLQGVSYLQIGGNESLGQGLFTWQVPHE